MKITIDRSSPDPLHLQIASQIRRGILSGSLAGGCRLPSERNLAGLLDVHRNTVSRVYQDLKSEGLIDGKQGLGYFVRSGSGEEPPRESGRAAAKAVHWDALIEDRYRSIRSPFDALYRLSFEEGLIPLGGGVAAREPYPPEEIAEVFENILKGKQGEAYFHTPYQGDPELRRRIADLMASGGIFTSPSRIQIFSENNQSLDFLNTLLLSEGDRVIIPEVVSPDVYRSIQMAGGVPVTVPMDTEGMLVSGIEQLIGETRPKYIYADSSFNNPTGVIMSLPRRHQLLDLSYRYRVPVIEEDEGSELYYEKPAEPSIRSMDPGSNVIYIRSLGLTMRPGLGVSFVIADPVLIRRLSNMVSLRLSSLDWMPQMMTLEYLKSGIFESRLPMFREVCRQKRDLMGKHLERMKKTCGIRASVPAGGVHYWVRLPEGLTGARLLPAAQKEGVTFIPGELFYPEKAAGKQFIRLNFSYPGISQIEEGMLMLERAVIRCLDSQGGSGREAF